MDLILFPLGFWPYRCECGQRFFANRFFDWPLPDSWHA
jgi:hypothetical protein